jgi:hypothetical protein
MLWLSRREILRTQGHGSSGRILVWQAQGPKIQFPVSPKGGEKREILRKKSKTFP